MCKSEGIRKGRDYTSEVKIVSLTKVVRPVYQVGGHSIFILDVQVGRMVWDARQNWKKEPPQEFRITGMRVSWNGKMWNEAN